MIEELRLDSHDERKLKFAMWEALHPYQNARHTRKNEAMQQSCANFAIRFFNDWLAEKIKDGDSDA